MIPNVNRGVSAVRARNSTLPTRCPRPGGTTIGRGSAEATAQPPAGNRGSMIVATRRARSGAVIVLVATLYPWSRLGSEFMPPLNEGSVMDMPSLFPGVGTAQAKQILQQRDAALARIPEVKMVLGKIGRAETATDMAPMSMIETIAILKERSEWRPGVTYDSIVAQANIAVRTPGVGNM